jgi:hypothetical protein
MALQTENQRLKAQVLQLQQQSTSAMQYISPGTPMNQSSPAKPSYLPTGRNSLGNASLNSQGGAGDSLTNSLDDKYDMDLPPPASPLNASTNGAQTTAGAMERGQSNRALREQAGLSRALTMQMAEVRRLTNDLNAEREKSLRLEAQLTEQHRLNYELTTNSGPYPGHGIVSRGSPSGPMAGSYPSLPLPPPGTPLVLAGSVSSPSTPEPVQNNTSGANSARRSEPETVPSVPPQLQLQVSSPARKVTKKQAEREKDEGNREAKIAVLEKMLELREAEVAKYKGELQMCSKGLQTDPPLRCAMSMQTDECVGLGTMSSTAPQSSSSDGAVEVKLLESVFKDLPLTRGIALRVYPSGSRPNGAPEQHVPAAPQLSGRWADETVDLEMCGGELVVPGSKAAKTTPRHAPTDSCSSVGSSSSPQKEPRPSIVQSPDSREGFGTGSFTRGNGSGNSSQRNAQQNSNSNGRPSGGGGNGGGSNGRDAAKSSSLPNPNGKDKSNGVNGRGRWGAGS